MQARDWTAIENEYVTGKISLQKLSEKYEIPLRTIANTAAPSASENTDAPWTRLGSIGRT